MESSPKFCQVALPLPLMRTFDYAIPEGMAVAPGCRVLVPFGNQKMAGIVTGLSAKAEVAITKPVASLLDAEPVVSSKMLEFTRWVADYYLSSWGEVLPLACPPLLGTKRPRKIKVTEGPPDPAAVPQIKAVLTPAQQAAFESIRSSLDQTKPTSFLLHGVTGSGKTEVYLQVLAEVLARGGGAIVLVPEIALTPQTLSRFSSRFPGQIVVLHSGLTGLQRAASFRSLAAGEARVALGARSALFAPVRDLKLIIVDEESEPSYKQENSPRYHARDAALMRARLEKATVVLGSATPSFESYFNAQNGKLTLLELPGRVGVSSLPTFHFLETGRQIPAPQSALEGEVVKQIQMRLDAGEQSLIFLNRRGFAPILACVQCGKAVQCPQCSISLTLHKDLPEVVGQVRSVSQEWSEGVGWLLCHLCGHTRRPPARCDDPKCDKGLLKIMGTGTQRLEQDLRQAFPKANILRVDRDTAVDREFHARLSEAMHAKKVDILVGTQMIAKGLDFPDLTLVAVVQADASLNFPDFRAAERTFQLLVQVAGRAGRRDKPGHVWVQSKMPDHPCLKAAARQDFALFYKAELQDRKDLSYPPYGRLAALVLRSKDKAKALIAASDVAAALNKGIAQSGLKGIDVLGPAPAPLVQIKGWWRYRLLVKSQQSKPLHDLLLPIVTNFKNNPAYLAVDIDPLNFL